jgi:hypothetical protein
MKTQCYRLSLFAVAASALFCLTLAAQTTTAVSRIVAPIFETNLASLKGNVHPLAQARFDRGPAPMSTPTGRIMLVLQRSSRR